MIYKCIYCEFQTKYKNSIKRHLTKDRSCKNKIIYMDKAFNEYTEAELENAKD